MPSSRRTPRRRQPPRAAAALPCRLQGPVPYRPGFAAARTSAGGYGIRPYDRRRGPRPPGKPKTPPHPHPRTLKRIRPCPPHPRCKPRWKPARAAPTRCTCPATSAAWRPRRALPAMPGTRPRSPEPTTCMRPKAFWPRPWRARRRCGGRRAAGILSAAAPAAFWRPSAPPRRTAARSSAHATAINRFTMPSSSAACARIG